MSMTATSKNPRANKPVDQPLRNGWTELESLCVDRLVEALGASPRLFNRQLRDGVWDRTHGTEDLTSTAISIIGLTRSGNDEFLQPDKSRILIDTMELAKRRRYGGGFGLLLWANAVFWQLDFERLLRDAEANRSNEFDDIEQHLKSLTTMETAWLSSGLMHQCAREGGDRLKQLTAATVACLESRFNPSSDLFFHADDGAALNKRLRRNIPNFADQIYSVQALAFAAMGDHSSSALSIAERAATRLVQLQGTLGQWWWHYDARTGTTAQTYPVYSVHQHAMAPMALMALREAGGKDFHDAIDKSLAWIETNETKVDMVDTFAGTIWRDIQPPTSRVKATVTKLASVAGVNGKTDTKTAAAEKTPIDFIRNHETRPYEWGWCLYAQAIAERRPKAGHLL